MILIFPFEN